MIERRNGKEGSQHSDNLTYHSNPSHYTDIWLLVPTPETSRERQRQQAKESERETERDTHRHTHFPSPSHINTHKPTSEDASGGSGVTHTQTHVELGGGEGGSRSEGGLDYSASVEVLDMMLKCHAFNPTGYQ